MAPRGCVDPFGDGPMVDTGLRSHNPGRQPPGTIRRRGSRPLAGGGGSLPDGSNGGMLHEAPPVLSRSVGIPGADGFVHSPIPPQKPAGRRLLPAFAAIVPCSHAYQNVPARLPGRPDFRKPSKNQPFRAHPRRRRAGFDPGGGRLAPAAASRVGEAVSGICEDGAGPVEPFRTWGAACG